MINIASMHNAELDLFKHLCYLSVKGKRKSKKKESNELYVFIKMFMNEFSSIQCLILYILLGFDFSKFIPDGYEKFPCFLLCSSENINFFVDIFLLIFSLKEILVLL